MVKERRSISKVSDKPVESWIKVLSLIALFTFPLIGFIGHLLIDGQKITNTNLSENTKEIVKTNIEIIKILSLFEKHESRIKRIGEDVSEIKNDYKEINIKVNKSIVEINKLKGMR
jgi:hypothetical protein